MRAKYTKMECPIQNSFFYKRIYLDSINDPWHYHTEHELILIENCSGTKIIGNTVSHFSSGDIIFIGSNIPHLIKIDKDCYDRNNPKEKIITYVHFSDGFLGDSFLELPELVKINKFLKRPAFAFKLSGTEKDAIKQALIRMNEVSPMHRLIYLLKTLTILSTHTSEITPLTYGYVPTNCGDTSKINFVFEYLIEHYDKNIYINDVASKLNMSVAAFSRYFKNLTMKPFSVYLTEIRIMHACKLLTENEFTVSEIGFKVGFENLSNFYRHFKKHTQTTPTEYRQVFIDSSNRVVLA